MSRAVGVEKEIILMKKGKKKHGSGQTAHRKKTHHTTSKQARMQASKL